MKMKNKKGVTLIELIIALMLISLALFSILSLFEKGYRAFVQQKSIAVMNQYAQYEFERYMEIVQSSRAFPANPAPDWTDPTLPALKNQFKYKISTKDYDVSTYTVSKVITMDFMGPLTDGKVTYATQYFTLSDIVMSKVQMVKQPTFMRFEAESYSNFTLNFL